MLVRDIIDIDSTYEDFDASDDEDLKTTKKLKNKADKEKTESLNKKEEGSNNDEDEFNVSLAKMEEEIKPKIINILDSLNKNYAKLQKYQIEKLDCLLASKSYLCQKAKTSKKLKKF